MEDQFIHYDRKRMYVPFQVKHRQSKIYCPNNVVYGRHHAAQFSHLGLTTYSTMLFNVYNTEVYINCTAFVHDYYLLS